MKKLITMRIELDLLNKLNELKKDTKLSRTTLIEEAIRVIVQLYRRPINEQKIEKTARELLRERSELYRRLANK